MEVYYLDPSTNTQGCLRLSTSVGFHSKPTDNPANAFYRPRLASVCDYQCTVLKDGLTCGAADGGYGETQVQNDDGFFDEYADMIFDGQPVRLLRGPHDGSYADFTVIISGVQCAPLFQWDKVSIKVRDYTELFDKTISPTLYLGNNVGGVGFEGTPEDLINQTKPTSWGYCKNVPAACISSSWMIFQVHDASVEEIVVVRIDGLAQTRNTTLGNNGDFATPQELVTAATDAGAALEGKFITCHAAGMFAIYGGQSSGVTADVKGDNTNGYAQTVGAILYNVIKTRTCTPFRNLLLYNDDKTNGAWQTTGTVELSTTLPPIDGMTVTRLEGGSVSQELSLKTEMYCYSDFFKSDGCETFEMKIVSAASEDDYVSASFSLSDGTRLTVSSAGTAVGPQYSATGFITQAEIFAETDGWYRAFVAGQPAESFTGLKVRITPLTGTGLLVGGGALEVSASPHKYPGKTLDAPIVGYDPDISMMPAMNKELFDALDTAFPYPVGLYTASGDTSTIGDVMGAIADSFLASWFWDRSGVVGCGYFNPVTLPTATPVVVFDESNIIQGSLNQTMAFDNSDGTPAYRVTVRGNQNFSTVDKANVASSLWESDPMLVMWLQEQYREFRAESFATLAKHPLACALSFDTCITYQSDCVTEAKRRLAIYGGGLRRFAFTTTIPYSEKLTTWSIVRIVHPRFKLSAGRNFFVTSISESHSAGTAAIEVLG